MSGKEEITEDCIEEECFQEEDVEEGTQEPVIYNQEDYPSIKFTINKNTILYEYSFCMEADSDHVNRIEENGKFKYVATKDIASGSPIYVGLPFWKFIMTDKYPKKSHILLSHCLKLLATSDIWQTLLEEVSFKELEPRTPTAEMLRKLKEDTDSGVPIEIGADMVHIYYKILHNMIQRDNRLFIYYRSSAFSHSCNPNASEYVKDNGMRAVRAIKDIKCGEDITVTYLTHSYCVNETKQREAMLEINCKICNCKLCTLANKRMRKKKSGKSIK